MDPRSLLPLRRPSLELFGSSSSSGSEGRFLLPIVIDISIGRSSAEDPPSNWFHRSSFQQDDHVDLGGNLFIHRFAEITASMVIDLNSVSTFTQ
jgi:hypothetical protein